MVAMTNRKQPLCPRVVLLLSSAATAYGGSESYAINIAGHLSQQISLGLIVGRGKFTQDFNALISARPIKWMGFPFVSRDTLFSCMLKESRLHQKINQFDIEAMGALLSLRRINRFLASADVLEVNYPTESLIFPFLRKDLKKLIRFHGPWLPPIFTHLRGRVQNCTDGYVTCSHWSRSELEKRLETSDIRVIHNGVDVTLFKPKDPDMSWLEVPYDPCLLKVGTAARLSRAKGIDILFQAAGELRGRAEFFVAGPVEKDFERELQRYGSHPHFHVLGSVPNHRMPDFHNFLDCFVLASRFETFPISLLEAMACGKPVIATQVGGIPEIIDHGKSGMLVASQDSAALYETLRTMIEQAPIRVALGKAARARVLQHFTLEKQADETRAFYENFSRQD